MADTLASTFSEQAPRRLATSSQALLVVDDDGVCTEASLGACRLFARARSDLVGETATALFEAASRDRFEHVFRAFRSGGGQAEPFTLEGTAAVPPVAIRVTAEVLPGRHLLRLEPLAHAAPAPESPVQARGGAGSATTERRGAREPSARERQVLALLAGGATDPQIAERLALSPATVQTHVRNAKAKLGARTRAQAVALAIQRGLIAIG